TPCWAPRENSLVSRGLAPYTRRRSRGRAAEGAALLREYTGNGIVGWNRSVSPACPRHSGLPVRLRPAFLVVFEGYAGGADHRCRRQVARKPSLRPNILRTSRPRNFGAKPVSAWIERDTLRPQFGTSILGPFARRVI